MPSIPVKNFQSTFAGMPVLTGVAGALIAVLDACLVNGGNLMTLDSLAVASGVLTGTKAGHGFVIDQVILIAGANQSQLNGEWRVTSVTGSTFSCDATGVANVAGTGTITAKFASAGWTKLFSGTNKAAYKSSNPAATGCVLFIDDTGTTTARCIGYESMTDIATGVGPFPTAAQVSGGGYIYKSNSADTLARNWAVFADQNTLFLNVTHYTTSYSFFGFGDYPSEKSGDAYRAFISCHTTSSYLSTNGSCQIGLGSFSTTTGAAMYGPRSYTQVGSAIQLVTATGPEGAVSGSGNYAYPAPTNNGLIVSVIPVKESALYIYRSLALPGVYATPQAKPLSHLDKATGFSALPGRTLQALAVGISSGESRLFIDITGPWV